MSQLRPQMEISENQLRLARSRSNLISARTKDVSPGDLVRRLIGIQAQELDAAVLAFRARSSTTNAKEVHRARLEERSLVWTWAMRGTLHFVATEDLGWLIPLVAPRALPNSRRRLAQLGLDEDLSAKAVRELETLLLREAPLTRAEIAERLAQRDIPTEGQAAYHIILFAALQGLVCRGPDRDKEPSYILVSDWVGEQSSMDYEAALAELARRYLAAYGPAALQDFSRWSGLTLSDARRAWKQISLELVEVQAAGDRLWVLASQNFENLPQGFVRLLPMYDIYLLGYRDRKLLVPSEFARKIHPGGGILHPAVVRDGKAIATWRSKRAKGGRVFSVESFMPLDQKTQDAIQREVEDMGRFLEVQTQLIFL